MPNNLLKLSLHTGRLSYMLILNPKSLGPMQAEVVKQVKTIRECVAGLENNEKNVFVVNAFIRTVIELIHRTEKPSDFLYPAFKHDIIDDLTLLTDKHVKSYWKYKTEQDKEKTFNYIQSELLYSLVLLQMTWEQN
jgi:hypothetical protein